MVWSPSKFYHFWLGNNVSICESTLAVCCVYHCEAVLTSKWRR